MQRILKVALAATLSSLLLPAASMAAGKTVDMGTPMSAQKTFQMKYGADVNDFFPHAIAVQVGQKVTFVPMGFHTVDLVPHGGSPLPLITPQGSAVSGANDAAGNAFWFNGQPVLGFNPALLQGLFGKSATFDGTKALDSGLPLGPPKPFSITFKKAGTYKYFCNVHPGMVGLVRVVPKSKPVPSAKKDAKTVAKQIARDLRIAKKLDKTSTPNNTVDVGSAGAHGVEVYAFFPQSLTVPAGTTVKFQMTANSFEDHTATAGPGDPSDPKQAQTYLGQLGASFEGPAPSPIAVYPSDAPGSTVSLTSTTHGNGFWNSGVMDTESATPLPSSASVTFTQPGTYTFHCLIHTFMHTTVTVK